MKKLIINISFSLVLIAGLASCKKDLVIEPRQSIRTENALVTRENINAAIIGVYARLKNLRVYGRDLIAVAEALGDNATFTNRSGRLVAENLNNPGAHFANWQQSYFAIAEINLIIEAIPSLQLTPAVTPAERNGWVGQLYFLRALFYHDLMRAYAYEPNMGVPGQDRGGVPIMVKTPKTIEEAVATLPARASVNDVYSLIYRDLDSAVTNLQNPQPFSPYFATRIGAQALYARVALYRGDYTTAKTMADNVINSLSQTDVRLDNTSSYVSGWSGQRHTESLFEVRFQNQTENLGVNESLQTSYTSILTRGNNLVVGGFGDLVTNATFRGLVGITQAGISSFPGLAITARTDDVRNLLFEVGSPARGPAAVECTKFIGKNGFPNLDNIPLIRLPEVYLIRAEAMSALGSPVLNLSAALNDLRLLKQNRYSNYATTQQTFDNNLTTQSPLFEEVLRQRRIEFAFEGHRWFDLKRLGRFPAGKANLPAYTDFKMLAPIPVREVDNNPNLVQNFNY